MSLSSDLFNLLRSELTEQLGRAAHVAKTHPIFKSEFWSEVKASYKGEDPKLKTYYERLELRYGSSLSEVKVAYKALVKRYHPDKFQDAVQKAKATEFLKMLNEAYASLVAHFERKAS